MKIPKGNWRSLVRLDLQKVHRFPTLSMPFLG